MLHNVILCNTHVILHNTRQSLLPMVGVQRSVPHNKVSTDIRHPNQWYASYVKLTFILNATFFSKYSKHINKFLHTFQES